MGWLLFIVGVAVGSIGTASVLYLARPARGARRSELPPATPWQIARAARAGRLHPPHSDRRRWISPADGDFDHEDTQ
jgi:hypothetical protein